MDYNQFLNQEVITKNNETGIVVSFEKERITIKFSDRESIFNPQVAFSNHFLSFKNDTYNSMMDNEYITKPAEELAQREKEHQFVVDRHKRVNARYEELRKKAYVLKKLFGPDYVYEPYEKLKKQYKHVVPLEEDWIRSLFKGTWCGYTWYYYL